MKTFMEHELLMDTCAVPLGQRCRRQRCMSLHMLHAGGPLAQILPAAAMQLRSVAW